MSLWEIAVSSQQGSLVNHFVFILLSIQFYPFGKLPMRSVFLGSSRCLCEYFDVLNVKKYDHAISNATLYLATYSNNDKNRQE